MSYDIKILSIETFFSTKVKIDTGIVIYASNYLLEPLCGALGRFLGTFPALYPRLNYGDIFQLCPGRFLDTEKENQKSTIFFILEMVWAFQ